MRSGDSCYSCKYWAGWQQKYGMTSADNDIHPNDMGTYGYCLRYPPKAKTENSSYSQPTVEMDDICGEYQLNLTFYPISCWFMIFKCYIKSLPIFNLKWSD